MDLLDTRTHIIRWYLALGLGEHDALIDKVRWLADRWYLAVDPEFNRQALKAYHNLNLPKSLDWKPRSWQSARRTVVVAAKSDDLLALVPIVISRGWKPSNVPLCLWAMTPWNPLWWHQAEWDRPCQYKQIDDNDAIEVGACDNLVLDARRADRDLVEKTLDTTSPVCRVVILRHWRDPPLRDVDVAVCARSCCQVGSTDSWWVARFHARVFYDSRVATRGVVDYRPWSKNAERDGCRFYDCRPRKRTTDADADCAWLARAGSGCTAKKGCCD
jgi:hypothetical protein